MPVFATGCLIAGCLAAGLLLADFHTQYFDFIQQTGGRGHRTFRTNAVEPKRAALDWILQQHAQHASEGPIWIVADEWWNRLPLQYLAMSHEDVDVTVVEPKEIELSDAFDRARSEGRVWYVEFCGSRRLDDVFASLADQNVEQRQFDDFGGNPVLCVVHAMGDHP